MCKVVCMGESLVDLIPDGDKYLAKAGGAPANVCACVSRLGGKGYFFGKLSTDGFSNTLYQKMRESSVYTDYVIRDGRYKTALAVVTLSDDGDRSFSFYHTNTADVMLDESEVPHDLLSMNDALHFCSVGLVESPSKYAHKKAINQAIEKGALISFDVNVRLGLYPSAQSCVDTIKEFLPFAEVVKMTDEELAFLTSSKDEDSMIDEIFSTATRAKILFVTRGADGESVYDRRGGRLRLPSVKADVIDTTGAGDCFVGSILYKILSQGFLEKAEDYKEYVSFAATACAIVCENKGAMESMPTLDMIISRGMRL